MTFEDIVNELKYGELNNHGMFMNQITEQDKQRLMHHCNIALVELCSRFPLITRELTVTQVEGVTSYVLTSEHTYQAPDQATLDKYIFESAEYPFNDDLVAILGVYDEIGNEIRMNDSTTSCTVFTPMYNIIEVPMEVDTNALFVLYQAKHPVITCNTSKIYIAAQFLPALLSYIAYRVYAAGTAQEHMVMANTLLQKYEMHCLQLRNTGVDSAIEWDANTRPCMGGWV
ncbi:hypothetical protein [Vibrio phage BUCT194]|uniref:Uncharacterized protein n=1 Tax=Vibrio phage BUCT194 TaxID=2859072 RepID=A0AAE8XFN9_9CAUD|nr:virion structural protein [Vibrio phage BUCT194]UAW01162.1 hypothetical protein [Vibrio phage BUCT194]